MELSADSGLNRRREGFFKLVFGASKGIVCLAFLKPGTKKQFSEEYFEYPEQLPLMLDAIEARLIGTNIYFCPQLLDARRRDKQHVVETPCLWADLDSCEPENLLVPPTVVLESSPGRFQAFWKMDQVDPDDAEDLSRRIAYHHAPQGADRTGWDLSQLLRVPYTYNYKYRADEEIPHVSIIKADRLSYEIDDFEEYPASPEYVRTGLPMPDISDLPQVSGEDLLQKRRLELNPLIWRYFQTEPVGSWSETLWNLAMLLFETGYGREEVYIICRDAKCNKWARDGKPAELLWKDVCRAEARASIHAELLAPGNGTHVSLLSEEERRYVDTLEDTFVERYQEWATSLGDAAPQYHQAGAFVALSSLLAGNVRLPTSYGTVVPNLWFMILADTTLTRKTTSMDIAIDLVAEIDEDAILATDGSLEGLLTSLAARPGRPSIFLRDEFSGLLEAMTKKDYMAGMPEMLTKMYDGKMQKRVLRKEIVEVRDPRLIFFAGGIKNKITGLLSFEHVASGFMPRFVFITAESDLNRLKPIGPPTMANLGNRDAMVAELTDISKQYNRTQVLHVEKLKTSIEQKMMWDATLTDDAWVRYNELESALLEAGLTSQRPEIMTPVGDRLAKSILKAALLIAASRQRDEQLVVEKDDILRAIKYGEQWRAHAEDVMENVGKGQVERQLDVIYGAIERRGAEGVSRSYLMQSYHLSARDASQIFETLEQRGKIARQRVGKTELLLPVNRKKKA